MRLGLLARADNSGLGNQTLEFYKAMQPAKTLVMDISDLNGNAVFLDRYPGAQVVKGILREPDIDEFLKDLDVIFVAEAPYNYLLYARAKELGVKVAVQYNYEFFDWFLHPEWPKPDMLIAPSKWHYGAINAWCSNNDIKHVYLHCPVNREVLRSREIRQARTFLHTAGRSAAHDRNGTTTVIEASAWLQTDAKIVIHFQGEQGLAHQATTTTQQYRDLAREYAERGNLTIVTEELANYADVYAMGDVLLLPRRYGGNCLPMNEALATGMPVLMTDISPNNTFLPGEWLIHANKIDQFEPRTVIDIYGAEPRDLARKIDEFYLMDEAQLLTEGYKADKLAESISWDVMKPQYVSAFEELVA
jgi:glycosyltransferase involved in cell wall biosynthesis